MSLLPGSILPQQVSLGRVNDDGTVTIDKDWWLLIYNLCQQVLGPIPTASLLDMDEASIAGADTAAVQTQISELAAVRLDDDLSEAPSRQDVADALLLAQNALDDASGLNFGGAAPTAKVGLTPVAGTATTFMRSDAAPPLDLSITVTWTGIHVFSPTAAATAVTINGRPGQYATVINAGASGGQCLHLVGSVAGNDTITIDTSATTGGQTASFAATNKPGAASGSPGKWLPILADGVQYYVPLFN